MTGSVSGPGSGPQNLPPEGPKTDFSKSAGSGKGLYSLDSPFAKMFEKSGAKPTVKEMKAIMNNILKGVINQMKKDLKKAQEASRKMKRVIEGQE